MRFLLLSFAMMLTAACSNAGARTHALRLQPGEDVKAALQAYVAAQELEAAAVVSAVGSLTDVALRLANGHTVEKRTGHFEIVSLSGTLSPDGVHLHMAVADEHGNTFGGHLMEGSRVYTTLELVVIEPVGLHFRRVQDPSTGYKELVVERRS